MSFDELPEIVWVHSTDRGPTVLPSGQVSMGMCSYVRSDLVPNEAIKRIFHDKG